jgi:oxygen-independent coproporphyrinogen-3 oxidase
MRLPLPTVLRLLFPSVKGPFVFDREQVVLPQKPASLNLYIHLPFCRNICHFCPYVKVPYDAQLSASYQNALLNELDSYRRVWGSDINIESVYFGGGTPSMTPDIVRNVLSWIDHNFRLSREVGMEIHPLDTEPDIITSLKDSGVTITSLGVQSFNDRLLGILRRGYDAEVAMNACERLIQTGFDTVDVDLIFAIPSQEAEEAENDIELAAKLGADQISSYPLIPFSYTHIKTILQETGLILPSWHLERRILKRVVKKALNAGYQRTSIWSFNRPESLRYTTVTRDYFVGIGAGASSRIGDYFWVNTFSLVDYMRATTGGQSPLALATRLTSGDKMAYWLFWQCYNTAINTDNFRSMFGKDLPYQIKAFLWLFGFLGLAYQEGPTTRLTDTGAYLFHLVEKEYTHGYLETLWQACFREAWPGRLVL